MSDKETSSTVVSIEKARSTSDNSATLDRIAREIALGQSKPPLFLTAWKDGIRLIGSIYFRVESETVAQASDKSMLCPDFDVIRDSLLVLSSGQSRFLIGMCEFYSDSGTVELCEGLGIAMPSLADIALLDEQHRAILIRLLESYTGW